MSLLIRIVRNGQNSPSLTSAIQAAQLKCLHTSSVSYASKDYQEIKLKPFKEQSLKAYEKWRRRHAYPHHVDNVKWRNEQDLPPYLNMCGPITDNPDYSYVDQTLQRPPTYGVGQRRRIIQQIDLAKTIVQYNAELDHGKLKYQNKLKAIEDEKQNLLKSKMSPKGTDVL